MLKIRTNDGSVGDVSRQTALDMVQHGHAVLVDPAEDLKGAALDEALEDAGLPKSGTADEKRARLVESRVGTGDPTGGIEGAVDDSSQS